MDCEVAAPPGSAYEFATTDPRSFLSAAYADFDGDGTAEALVTVVDESCGAMSVDQHDVFLFGAGPRCAPTALHEVTLEACGIKKLNGTVLQVDRRGCFEPPAQEQWTVVKGKLQKKK